MNIKYYSRQLSTSFKFDLPTIDLDLGRWLNKVFAVISGLRISGGWWINIKIDRVDTPSKVSRVGRTEGSLYSYDPLPGSQIRLLALQPGTGDDDLQGELLLHDLECTLDKQYAALSYVWGKATFSDAVFIGNARLPITPNSGRCLRALRSANAVRTVWMDAICVNQRDLEERGLQVSMMDKVYSMAPTVLIWLGNANIDSGAGMQVLRYFASTPRPDDSAPWKTLPPNVVSAGLKDIMGRDWFQRMWVAQEAALSRKTEMVCGSSSVSWDPTDVSKLETFIRMIKYAEIQPEWQNRRLNKVNMRPMIEMLELQVRQQSGIRPRILDRLDLAYDLRHRRCADPRDRLHALRGLAKDMPGEELPVDYRTSVEQVYERFGELIDFSGRYVEEAPAVQASRERDIAVETF